MMLRNLSDVLKNKKSLLFPKDVNDREIYVHEFKDVVFVNNHTHYPDVKFCSYEDGQFYNPIEETVMSLQAISNGKQVEDLRVGGGYGIEKIPVFYFIYNTDNYYHFVYDTLPYLISYIKLRVDIPNLKLLMNFPNKSKNEFYKFVEEFFELLPIDFSKDVLIVDSNLQYESVYVSSSYTHGIDSNKPPRTEIYSHLYTILKQAQKVENNSFPKKIYVSRRSWKHGDYSNIGTNYTSRRKMVNEDELVEFLESKGYTEVFPETMSLIEKINMFYNATHIIGAIGGGLVNALFSTPNTKLLTIMSPEFLKVNGRFLYSFENVNDKYFYDTKHVESGEFKKWMRVQYKDIVGEVDYVDIDGDVWITYTPDIVAGWSQDGNYNRTFAPVKDCKKLDNGLNSEWSMDLNKFKQMFEKEGF